VGNQKVKLFRVKVNNLGYFWELSSYVTFTTYLFARVTLSFLLSYVLDCYGNF